MNEKIKKIILISRPISWPNTAYPFAAGYLLSGGKIDLLFILATLYFIFPYNLLMYGINDVYDYESDIRNPRKGGIEGMKEQRSLHPVIIKSALITNIPLVVALVALSGLIPALVLLGVVFFVVAYSQAGLRFKEKPVIDSITSSLHFVGPLIFALSLNGFPASALVYVIAFFLWGFASHAFGAVQDIIPDRQGNIASIATFFGGKDTIRISFVFYVIAAAIVAYQPMPQSIIGFLGFLYAFNIFNYLNISDKQSGKVNLAWRRFIWLNPIIGFILTMILIFQRLI